MRSLRARPVTCSNATPRAELLEAIREVHRGGSPMTTHIARKVVQSFQKAGASAQPTENLSAARTGSAGLPEPRISLQGNRGKTGHQLRNGPYLHPPDLRKLQVRTAHRGGGEVPAALAREAKGFSA